LASSNIWPLHFLPFNLPTADYPFGIFQSLTIALYVLRFTASDYPFDIFKLFVPYIVIGYIVDHYCLMFIREVAPVVLLLTITV
jgi:hypothetical protein